MNSDIPLFPNPGRLGRYETTIASELGLQVYQAYVDEYPTETDISVREFSSKPRGPATMLRARLSSSFYRPPRAPDALVSTGHIGKEVVPHPGQHHVHLTHGLHRGSFGFPPRDSFADSAPRRFLQRLNRLWLRDRERQLISDIDTHVVNSQFTGQLLEEYHDITVDKVINPPVDTDSYYDDRPTDKQFYLFIGRLEPIKRVKEIVAAFKDFEERLLVAGTGSLESDLRDKAGDNVDILGYVPERKKQQLLAKCKGFIQNSVAEDFGMTTVEALASGAPVVAVADGNNPNLVEEGTTGVLYAGDDASRPFQTTCRTEDLRRAVETASTTEWDHEYIQSTAAPYDQSVCLNAWRELLTSLTR